MKSIDKLLNSDLFKNAMADVTQASVLNYDDYLMRCEELKKDFDLNGFVDIEKCISLYNNALLSYRMDNFDFGQLNSIYMKLSCFLCDMVM